jgi:hypothetical protein
MVLVIVIVKVIVIRILIAIVTVNGNSNSNSSGKGYVSNWHNLMPGSACRAKWSQGGQEGGRGRPEPPEPAMTANGMAQRAARTGQMTG